MFLKIFLIIASIALVNSEYVNYRDHKVYRITPENEKEVKLLTELNDGYQYPFWTDSQIEVGKDVRIQVAPEKIETLEKYLAEENIKATCIVEDIQRLIEDQLKRPAAVSRNARDYAWNYYQTLDEIYEWMDATAAAYPDVASVVTIGSTVNGRPIRGMVIDYKTREHPYFAVVEGGLHAREWISPATTTWMINEFLTSTDPGVRALAEDIVWHIFPVTNPDGYVYTFTDNRMWRKNRNPANFTTCAPWGVSDDMSNGIDLNRNFDFMWMTIGASQNPCSEVFAGPVGFSEEESIAIFNYINALKTRGTVMYYLSFHSFTQLILVPFSHASGSAVLEAPNYGDLFEIAIKASDKITERHNTPYTVGTSGDILYYVSGSGFDWAYGSAQIPLVYLVELRDLGQTGFLLPPDQIVPNNEEVIDGLVEMDRVAKAIGYYGRSAACSVASTVVAMIISLFAMITLNY